MASISRQLAQFVSKLRYEDLPPAVVDRAKGVTLQCLASVLLGSQTQPGKQAAKLIKDEELGVKNGATILVDGSKVTKAGAAFANSEMAFAGGKWDTFRMLTHPGTSIVPTALIAAESAGASGKDFITGLVAGYEVAERIGSDWIAAFMARGFHPGPTTGIFGAAVAAGKIMGLDEDQINSAIAACVSLAGGNPEAPREGGKVVREGAAVRNAMLAVALAKNGHEGGESTLEGPAGFYHAFTGNNHGQLAYSFAGATHASLDRVTRDLGKEWIFLETLYRIYSISGYNIAHIDVTAALCKEHDIKPENVEKVEAVVNWLETQYPSPAYPIRREDVNPKPGGTVYYSAYAVVHRGLPILQSWGMSGPPNVEAEPAVVDMMKRVTLIPSHTMGLFAPRISITTKDGKTYTKQATGREFIWDFEEQARRISPVASGLPIPADRFEKMIATCRNLDREARADVLVGLTIP